MEGKLRNFADYASVCQDLGIVPIVEPEILLWQPYNRKMFD
jgi:fructose-bisphosphate aldolase class 1